MKQHTVLAIGISIYLCIILFSCKPIEKVNYKYNGVFRIQVNGKEFVSINVHDKGTKIMVDTVSVISLKDFSIVRMGYHLTKEEPELQIQLTESGKIKFANLTRNNINKPLAIILNDKLVQIAVVQGEITNGELEILGIDKELIKELIRYFKD